MMLLWHPVGVQPPPGVATWVGLADHVQRFIYCVDALCLAPLHIRVLSYAHGRTFQEHLRPSKERADDTAKHCFTVAFSIVFIREVLGLADDDARVLFQSEITQPSGEAIPLDWPLGAMITQASHLHLTSAVVPEVSEGWGVGGLVHGRGVGLRSYGEVGGLSADRGGWPLYRTVLWALLWVGVLVAAIWALWCDLVLNGPSCRVLAMIYILCFV
jgi:hypothetical protein